MCKRIGRGIKGQRGTFEQSDCRSKGKYCVFDIEVREGSITGTICDAEQDV